MSRAVASLAQAVTLTVNSSDKASAPVLPGSLCTVASRELQAVLLKNLH